MLNLDHTVWHVGPLFHSGFGGGIGIDLLEGLSGSVLKSRRGILHSHHERRNRVFGFMAKSAQGACRCNCGGHSLIGIICVLKGRDQLRNHYDCLDAEDAQS